MDEGAMIKAVSVTWLIVTCFGMVLVAVLKDHLADPADMMLTLFVVSIFSYLPLIVVVTMLEALVGLYGKHWRKQ